MMKPRFFVDDAIIDINKEIDSLVKKGEDVDPVLDDIGRTIYLAVRQALPRSKVHHVHMQDEVTYDLRTNKNGERYVSIRGEHETGYKWHIVNDDHLCNTSFTRGSLRKNGYKTAKGMKATIVAGLHFIDKALASSQHKVDMLIDGYVEGIVDDTTN